MNVAVNDPASSSAQQATHRVEMFAEWQLGTSGSAARNTNVYISSHPHVQARLSDKKPRNLASETSPSHPFRAA
jgi:hypothetical protein